MRDVVERAAHAADHRVDAIEHRVHQHAQISERIVGLIDRHARVRAPRLQDAADRVGERAHRTQRGRGERRAADQADQHDEEEIHQQHPAEPAQQLLAPLRAATDLKERSIAEPNGDDLEDDAVSAHVERRPLLFPVQRRRGEMREVHLIPVVGDAEIDHVLAPADRADQQRTGCARRLRALDLARQPVDAAAGVGGRELRGRVLDDVAVVLPQGDRQQQVSDADQRHRADGEDQRVPPRQAQAERLAQTAIPA